jgi:hypothetical protein
MICERCEGLMLQGDFIDMEESFEGMWLRAWRCLNCGHAVDSVMAANRQRQALLSVKKTAVLQETLAGVMTPLAA